ncbi:hypothetical protein LLG07_00045 [bacterium]|nr:hypothetical protein [bacterium]
MKYIKTVSEIPLVNLISKEDLENLNKRFRRNYKHEPKTFARIIQSFRFKELKKLMEEKPKGGYGA